MGKGNKGKKGKRGGSSKGSGSMMRMRGGFKKVLGGKSKKKGAPADPQQFVYIFVALFVLGALMFFASR